MGNSICFPTSESDTKRNKSFSFFEKSNPYECISINKDTTVEDIRVAYTESAQREMYYEK